MHNAQNTSINFAMCGKNSRTKNRPIYSIHSLPVVSVIVTNEESNTVYLSNLTFVTEGRLSTNTNAMKFIHKNKNANFNVSEMEKQSNHLLIHIRPSVPRRNENGGSMIAAMEDNYVEEYIASPMMLDRSLSPVIVENNYVEEYIAPPMMLDRSLSPILVDKDSDTEVNTITEEESEIYLDYSAGIDTNDVHSDSDLYICYTKPRDVSPIHLCENPLYMLPDENNTEFVLDDHIHLHDCEMDSIYDKSVSTIHPTIHFIYEKQQFISPNDLQTDISYIKTKTDARLVSIQETFYVDGGVSEQNEVYRHNHWFSLENKGSIPLSSTNDECFVTNMIFDSSTQSVFAVGSFSNINVTTTIHNVAKYDTRTHTWDGLYGGINSIGLSLAIDSTSQSLFVGGVFSNVGPENDLIYANNIAKYDCVHKKWESMQHGINSDCFCMAYNEVTGQLFVGGNFTMSGPIQMKYIGIYDVTAQVWKQIPGGDVNGPCHSMCLDVSNQLLYIGGTFSEVGHSKMNANRVAVYNIATDSWWELNGGIGGAGKSLVLCKTICLDAIRHHLYVGGLFSSTGGNNESRVYNVARYDISNKKWDSLSGGVNNICNTLVIDSANNQLYAGGSFTHLINTNPEKKEVCSYVAKYDIEQSVWSTFSKNVSDDITTTPELDYVGINGICKTICMTSKQDCLYYGGLFTKARDMNVNGIVGYRL